jgi:hypothetical protein
VRVVGGDRLEVEQPADLQQALAHRPLDRQAVVHQLEEEVVGAEDVLVVGRGLDRRLLLAQPQPGLHLAGRAAGGGDDAGAVLGDELAVHPGLAVVALHAGQRGQLEEVPQPGRVLREHRHVGVGTGARDVAALTELVRAALVGLSPEDGLLVEAALRRDVGLDADDRLEAVLLGLLVELVAAVHVAVVGHADRGHAEARRLREERGDLRRTVEHRVLGVDVQVDEGIVRHQRKPPLGEWHRRARASHPIPHSPGSIVRLWRRCRWARRATVSGGDDHGTRCCRAGAATT